MSLKKKLLLLVIIVAILALAVKFFSHNNSQERGKVKIGDTYVSVDIADTPAKQEQGLSGRKSLLEQEGMLFIFDKAGNYGFWMKDMKFSIDIIWISERQEVVGMEESLSPDTYPQAFYPPQEVKYVLEVPAGFAQRHGVKMGQILSIGHEF